MATILTKLAVSIFEDDDRLTHWQGEISTSGGALKLMDSTPVGGPPQMDFDSTGNDREPFTMDIKSQIVGATLAAQKAFIAKYPRGRTFTSDAITGVDEITGGGINFVIQETQISHDNSDAGASMLTLKLAETGPADGGVVPVGSGGGGGA